MCNCFLNRLQVIYFLIVFTDPWSVSRPPEVSLGRISTCRIRIWRSLTLFLGSNLEKTCLSVCLSVRLAVRLSVLLVFTRFYYYLKSHHQDHQNHPQDHGKQNKTKNKTTQNEKHRLARPLRPQAVSLGRISTCRIRIWRSLTLFRSSKPRKTCLSVSLSVCLLLVFTRFYDH